MRYRICMFDKKLGSRDPVFMEVSIRKDKAQRLVDELKKTIALNPDVKILSDESTPHTCSPKSERSK